MNQKIGRNDPCPCGSGKKFKNCCFLKKAPGAKHKLKAKWLNAPQGPNLMERAFGDAIAATEKTFTPIKKDLSEEKTSEDKTTNPS